MIRKGRITQIERCNVTSMCLTQKISAKDQYKYDNSDKYKGRNGSYTSNHSTEYHIYAHVTMYETEEYPMERILVDIRKDALNHYGMQRISPQKLAHLKELNEGNKILFKWDPILEKTDIASRINY